MKLGVVWVHYRTPQLLGEAVRSVERQIERLGLEARQLVIDQSAESGNAALWRDLPVERLVPEENLGYARGVNLGVSRLADSDLYLVANPDVRLFDNALSELLRGLGPCHAAAGPLFTWDAAGAWLLPPTEKRSRFSELLGVLALRSPRAAAWARRRWRRHAWRHWHAPHPLESSSLSGALLLLRRAAWGRTGPFDPGYPLYFEETDWLLRLRRAGESSVFVPRARVWHLHAQSSRDEPRAQAWYELSARRFRERAYGSRFSSLLARLEAWALQKPLGWASLTEKRELSSTEGWPVATMFLEISPRPQGFPAARVERRDLAVSLPEIQDKVASVPLALTLLDRSGRELGSFLWQPKSRDGAGDPPSRP